jgi:hypothetical protein
MASTNTAGSPLEARCKVCREDIRVGARKCTHCDSYQDWRRLMGFSQSVLSLLVALVSVSVVAVPVFYKLFATETDDLRISILELGGPHLTLIVSNVGSRAGAVRSVRLNKNSIVTLYPTLTGDCLILPGKSVELRAEAKGGRDAITYDDAPMAELGPFTLEVDILRFDGRIERRALPVPYEDYAPWTRW